MNDLHLLAALHHITDTAPDGLTQSVLSNGAGLSFTGQGAVLSRADGTIEGRFVLGEPCPRFASVPLLFLDAQATADRRPYLWRTIPAAVLYTFAALVA